MRYIVSNVKADIILIYKEQNVFKFNHIRITVDFMGSWDAENAKMDILVISIWIMSLLRLTLKRLRIC